MASRSPDVLDCCEVAWRDARRPKLRFEQSRQRFVEARQQQGTCAVEQDRIAGYRVRGLRVRCMVHFTKWLTETDQQPCQFRGICVGRGGALLDNGVVAPIEHPNIGKSEDKCVAKKVIAMPKDADAERRLLGVAEGDCELCHQDVTLAIGAACHLSDGVA